LFDLKVPHARKSWAIDGVGTAGRDSDNAYKGSREDARSSTQFDHLKLAAVGTSVTRKNQL
jgi:hypothetical protein